jgi:hypothetical protein
MMKKKNLIMAIAAFLLFSNFAIAQTTMPLNSGYDHSVFSAYPTVTTDPSPGLARDNSWIAIASFPATSPPVDRAWVLRKAAPWLPAFNATNWIGARNTASSPAGTTVDNPAYTIFRKCFCLLPNFQKASLSFDARADDTIQVWLNSQVNQVLAPTWGNWAWNPPRHGQTSNGFRVGKNCLYVLVEDFQGHMGFDLVGSVTAYGLLPMPAAGTGQSFEPCACGSHGPAGMADARSAMRIDDNDDQVISAIVKIAEARRAAKQKRIYEGEAPKLEVLPDRTDPIKRPNN